MVFARLLRSLTRFRRIQPQVGRLHAVLLRASGGRLRRSRLLAGGQPVLALSTTGRRSGQQRTTTVAYLPYAGAYAVSAANLGSDRDPGWCLNLKADPAAVIDVAGQRLPVRARQAQGEEAEALWSRIIERLPPSGHFRQLARREIPVFVLDPVV